jgi:hypothetical protein
LAWHERPAESARRPATCRPVPRVLPDVAAVLDAAFGPEPRR